MENNPLKQLGAFGQSIWLDYIRRDLITSGELTRLIEKDGLRGMTSNPSIFEKAIVESHDYDEDIRSMALKGTGAKEIYEALSQHDVRSAADAFRSLYDKTDGQDGYVSLEVNPHLAHDTDGTVQEARRLWVALNRPNVFIKVPATVEGLPAIQQLISEGINVNVTLLFGVPRYRQVAEAYIAGIEARVTQGKDLKHVASVASFFVSRIDVLVDNLLETILAQGGKEADLAKDMRGHVAVASAKLAYQNYKELFGGVRFKNLTDAGARVQRLLWASTGTKDPEYRDVKYVEALIGVDTVDTAPVETLDAFRDHGIAKASLEKEVAEAVHLLQRLPALGIDLDHVTQQLEDEGVAKFNLPFDKLMGTLVQKERPSFGECVMKISPLAGKPAPSEILVNVPRLLTAYYTENPAPSVPEERVVFGTSGHRGSSFKKAFNEGHILAISQAVCLYRKRRGIDGPLFLGMDTHALSVPALATVLEVLAANKVSVMLAQGDEYTPTPVISHAILTYNRRRKTGLKWLKRHTGNGYPTHGLGSVCQYMGINRGDRMESLASMSTLPFGLGSAMSDKYGKESWQAKTAGEIKMGDINTSIIRTRLGKTIMVQYNTQSPRPYSRLNLILGIKGVFADYPLRVALDPNSGNWMSDKDLEELKAKHVHPLWDKNGAVAQKRGGHGGMDYLMEYRLCHCLLNGLPLDQDVYDGATWSSLVELSERSVLNGGSAVEIPDFTRGAWRTAQPLGIVGC